MKVAEMIHDQLINNAYPVRCFQQIEIRIGIQGGKYLELALNQN